MNFKNMEIEINKDQPLDDVVRELERLGYKQGWFGVKSSSPILVIDTLSNGTFECFNHLFGVYKFSTTLAELKEMK